MLKRIQVPKLTKIIIPNTKALNRFPEWLDRAEASFERSSGWKPKAIKDTLQNFARLKGRDKVLFGGLLVGRAILGGGAGQAEKRAPRPKAKRAAEHAPAAETPAAPPA